MDRKYEYMVYRKGTYGGKKQFVMEVSANSINEAIKKAGFDWVGRDENGELDFTGKYGQIIKSRKGIGYTNSRVLIYMPEDIASKSSPEFVFERIL